MLAASDHGLDMSCAVVEHDHGHFWLRFFCGERIGGVQVFGYRCLSCLLDVQINAGKDPQTAAINQVLAIAVQKLLQYVIHEVWGLVATC